MKENKNLERLFQEKFKDFQAPPPLESWSNIENKLNPKHKKKKLAPLFFTGLASAVVLAFLLINVFNTKQVINDVPNPKSTKTSSIKEKNQNNTSLEGSIKNNREADSKEEIKKTNRIVGSDAEVEKRASAVPSSKLKTTPNTALTVIKPTASINTQKNTLIKPKNKRLKKVKSSKFITGSAFVKPASKAQADIDLKENSTLASTNKSSTNKKNPAFGYSVLKASKQEKDLWANQQNKLKTEGTFLLDKDSTSTNLIQLEEEPLVLQQLEPQKNEGKNANEKELKNKWAVSAIIAPIYFNKATNNSFLDEQFNTNDLSVSNTTSVGLGVQYKINNRWSLNTGVQSLNMNQHTEQVLYRSQLNQNFQSISNLKREGFGTIIDFYTAAAGTKFEDITVLNRVFTEGSLQQELRFIEVPLEANYQLLDKKFKIDIIGGFSTFLLDKNNIYLQNNNMQMRVGEASNVNNIHFSSNIGLGFRYLFFNGLQANLRPVYKQQINTFNSVSGSTNQSFFGFYTGFSYLF